MEGPWVLEAVEKIRRTVKAARYPDADYARVEVARGK